MAKSDTKPQQKNTEQSMIAPNTIIPIEVDAQTAQEAYKKVLKKLSTRVKLAGFRKGKVPSHLAEKQLGEEQIIRQALDIVVPSLYQETIKSQKKQPLTTPEFNIVSAQKGESWKLEAHIAEAPEVSVKGYEKLVSQARESAQKEWESQQKEKPKEEAAEKPMSPEQTERQQRDFILQHIYQKLITELKVAVPELMVKREAEYELEQLVKQLRQFNLTLDDYLQRQNRTFQDLSAEIAAGALGRLQLSFILQSIQKEADITIKEEAINAWIESQTDSDFSKKHKDNPEYRAYVSRDLQQRALADHLLSV